MYDKVTNEPIILFASRPCYDELCAMTIHILNPGNIEMSSQPHVIRCRELIFTEPDIISTPSLDFDQCFYVIVQHKLYKTGRLQARFEKKGLKASSPYRVLPALYQACLRYTLTAKMAPSWNRIGEWHLQGRDFVAHNGYMNGIKMNLVVNSSELYMSVFGTSVKCPHLQIHDLDIDTISLSRMFEGDKRFQTLELDQWCYILPSMKKGRLVSVSRQIPQYDCPFRTYKDLKKHWKNTYGYRLPDTDEEILFYQVTFLPLGGRLFTYPSVCLCSRNIQTMSRIDPKPIITSFLQDIHSKIPSICGQPFQFQPKLRYPQQEFQTSSEINEKAKDKPNLVSRNPKPPTIPLRHVNQVQHMYQSKSVTNINRIIQSTSARHSLSSENVFISQPKNQTQNSKKMTIDNDSKSGESAIFVPENEGDRSVNGTCSNVTNVKASQEQKKSTRIIPLFRPRYKTVSRQVYKPELPKKVPSFSAQSKPPIPVTVQKTFSLKSLSPKKPALASSPYQILPIFSSSQKTKSAFTLKTISTGQSLVPKICPNFAQKKTKLLSTPKSTKLKLQNNSYTARTSEKPKIRTPTHKKIVTTPRTPQIVPESLPNTPGETSFVPFGANPKALSTPKPRPSNFSITQSKTPVFSISDTIDTSFDVFNSEGSKNTTESLTPKVNTNLVENQSDNWMLKTPDGKAKKRKETGTPSLSQGEGGKVKKPRAKSKVQDVDVEKLAHSNQMGKANAFTLTTWLKQRNVGVKAKDKKSDLVDKVFSFLNLARPTELPSPKLTPKIAPCTPQHADSDDSSSGAFENSLTNYAQKSTEFSHSMLHALQIPEA